jgi:hypothetical protein
VQEAVENKCGQLRRLLISLSKMWQSQNIGGI